MEPRPTECCQLCGNETGRAGAADEEDMIMDFRKRTDDDGDAIECDCCHYPGRVSLFEKTCVQGGKYEDLWLCELCAGTHLAIARKYPSHCPDTTLYVSLAQLGNMLLDAIRGEDRD